MTSKKKKELVLTLDSGVDYPLSAHMARLKKMSSKAPFQTIRLEISRPFRNVYKYTDNPALQEEQDLQTWDSFFEGVSKLNTNALFLKGSIPAAALIKAVQNSTLKNLHLDKVHFLGSTDHMQALTEALRTQSHLESVTVDRCHHRPNEYNYSVAVHVDWDWCHNLMMALDQVPTLQRINWSSHPGEESDAGFQTLSLLSNSPKLKKLELHFFRGEFGGQVQPWIASLNDRPNSALESLTFWGLRHYTHPGFVSDLAVQQLANFLTTNRTLEELVLNVLSLQSSIQPLIQALRTNRTLQVLDIYDCKSKDHKPTKEFENDVLAMLEDNLVLSRLDVPKWKKPKEIGDLLLLNRAGRAHIGRAGQTREDWVNALVICCRNVTGLYFYLRHKPSLIMDSYREGNMPELGTIREDSKPKAKKRKRKRKY